MPADSVSHITRVSGPVGGQGNPRLTWEADFLGLKPSCFGEQAGEVVLPEDAEPLPLSVNQEKGRNGEAPDLPEPSTDSLWREHPGPHGCGRPGQCRPGRAAGDTSYLLPMDSRLLPFSFRLLPVDARRRVTLWDGTEGSGQSYPRCHPHPCPLSPVPSTVHSLTPGPRTSGASSCPGRWWGWRARGGWHPGCHLWGKRGGNSQSSGLLGGL